MPSSRVGVVTGANRGIGKCIVEQMCQQKDTEVVLACRDVASGKKVADELMKKYAGSKIVVGQLDIADEASVTRFGAEMRKQYPAGLDFLVNNAGFAYPGESKEVPFAKQATDTVSINYFGTLRALKALMPAMKSSTLSTAEPARVVSFASMAGQAAFSGCSEALQKRLEASKTEAEVTQLMEEFLADVKAGNHSQKGWPTNSYGVSKMGLICLTRATLNPGVIAGWAGDKSKDGTCFISLCPGWCLSDMSGAIGDRLDTSGARTTEQGATEAVFLSTPSSLGGDPRGAAGLRGKFSHPIQSTIDNMLAKGATGEVLRKKSSWTDGIVDSMAHGGKDCPELKAKL